MKKIASFAAAASLLTFAGVASAGVMDSDPANDTQAGADMVTLVDGVAIFGAELVSGQTGDVDWFTFDVPANSFITIAIIPLEIPLQSPDTLVGLFDSMGNELAFNDDSNGGTLGSSIQFANEGGAADWSIAVSGFPDFDFDGSHSQTGSYIVKLSIVPIPTPGAIAIAGLAGLAATRRRR